jgi:hypothetical protein
VIHCWKVLDEGYNFSLDLIVIGGLHKKLCALKVIKVPGVAISRLPLGNPGTKSHLDVAQSILYGGRWWLPSNSNRSQSCESKVVHGSS